MNQIISGGVALSGSHLESNRENLRRVIREVKPKSPQTLQQPLCLKHGWLLPLLLLADDFLWRRWHHWYVTASAREVVAPIPRIEWQRNEAGFKMLDRSLSAITKYGDWRGWNSWAAFDYFMDWLLFAFGHKGQSQLPDEKDEYRGASDRLYQVFNLETLLAFPHDYLGDILAENNYGRGLGFFPTPMEVSELMAAMTIGNEDAQLKSVGDPCVGTGRLLLAASNYSYRLYGCDINPTVIKATLVNGFLYAPFPRQKSSTSTSAKPDWQNKTGSPLFSVEWIFIRSLLGESAWSEASKPKAVSGRRPKTQQAHIERVTLTAAWEQMVAKPMSIKSRPALVDFYSTENSDEP